MRECKKMHNYRKQIGEGGYRCESVSSFPYLGSVINDNSIPGEIAHRIKKGNRACYAYKGLIMTFKLTNMYTKRRIYMV